MAKKGDLQVTIKADSKEFDKTISNSTNQIRKFTKDTEQTNKSIQGFQNNISSLAAGALSKLVGALGVAVTSYETLNGIIQSTQGTADAFDITIQQVRSSVDYFFTSIANGDFSNFWKGLDGAIQRGRILAETLDNLGDVQAGYSDLEFDIRVKIDDNNAIIYDTSSTQEQIKKAVEDNKKLIAELERVTNQRVVPAYREAIKATFENASQMSGLTESDIDEYMKIQLKDNERYSEYVDRVAELEKRAKETVSFTQGTNYGSVTMSSPTADAQQAKKELELLKSQNSELEKYRIIENNITDEEKNQLVTLRQQYKQTERNISLLEKQNSRYEKRANKTSGSSSGTIKPEVEPIPDGSIAAIDKQLSDLNKKISLSIDPEEQRKLYQQIQELRNQKIAIEVQYQYSKPEDIGVNTDFSVKPTIDIQGDIDGMSDWFKGYQSNLKKMEEESITSADNIGLAFSSMANVFGTLGSVSDDTTSRMLGGFQTVLGGIATLIPAIQSLVVAEQAGAIASATSSGAKMPYPLNLVAIASGIAAVIAGFAQMSKIPAFADGGLVYGNTIAQVGEYPGASNNPEVIAPLSKLKNILADSGSSSGAVDFRISGKDLVGVLSNYQSIKKKK